MTARPQTLYRLFDQFENLLYVGISSSALARFHQHKNDKHWWGLVDHIKVGHYASRELVEAAERQAIRDEQPLYNVVHNQSGVSTNQSSPLDDDDRGWFSRHVTGDVRSQPDGTWQARFNRCEMEPFTFLSRAAAARWLKLGNPAWYASRRFTDYVHDPDTGTPRLLPRGQGTHIFRVQHIFHGDGLFPKGAYIEGTVERLWVMNASRQPREGNGKTFVGIEMSLGGSQRRLDVLAADNGLMSELAATRPSEGDTIRLHLEAASTMSEIDGCGCKWKIQTIAKAATADYAPQAVTA